MTSLNISLPRSLKDYGEAQVQRSGYSTPSEFVRELLRQDQRRRAAEQLEAVLLEGLDSGEPIKIMPDYGNKKCRELAQRRP